MHRIQREYFAVFFEGRILDIFFNSTQTLGVEHSLAKIFYYFLFYIDNLKKIAI